MDTRLVYFVHSKTKDFESFAEIGGAFVKDCETQGIKLQGTPPAEWVPKPTIPAATSGKSLRTLVGTTVEVGEDDLKKKGFAVAGLVVDPDDTVYRVVALRDGKAKLKSLAGEKEISLALLMDKFKPKTESQQDYQICIPVGASRLA